MKKCLLFAALLTVLQVNYLRAQNLFEAPDTVCPGQLVQLKSNFPSASTHYWGFCTGYMLKAPAVDTLQDSTNFPQLPWAIEVAEEKGNYYGFAVDRAGWAFLKYEFGNSLNNRPKVTNYGNLDSVLPYAPSSLYIVKTEDSVWHIFVAGGDAPSNSTLARIDLKKDLNTVPNIVNFGGLGNKMINPTGLFVVKDENKWFGFVVNNRSRSELLRIEFDSNISFTPKITDLGKVIDNAGTQVLVEPNDMTAIKQNGLWHFFVVDKNESNLLRIDMGSSLMGTTPIADKLGNLLGALSAPSGISITKDCDSFYAVVTNRGDNSIARVKMPAITGPYIAEKYKLIEATDIYFPSAISNIIRDRDEIFAIATNANHSISLIKFNPCLNSSIPFSLASNPPAYSYDTAGDYKVYYIINEGKPDMQVQCKLITVQKMPSVLLFPSDTVICQGDTIYLSANTVNAFSYTWSPDHNLESTNGPVIKAWPDYPITYKLHMPFPHDCVLDTSVRVYVKKVKADAGPDRTIADGASTILGGPKTSVHDDPNQYLHIWSPNQYIDDIHSLNPVVNPPYDLTYTLRVVDKSDSVGRPCLSYDTVVVRVSCKDLNLPNAFIPGGGNNTRERFGLSNQQVVKLNYFKIYDRWGKMVFTAGDETSADPGKEWDGTVNGADAPMGVYTWMADGFCASGDRVSKSGNVTLIR